VADIVASLVSSIEPRPVQVVVTGLAAGVQYAIVGTTADGSSWPVPGGAGVSSGSQIVLVDNRAAMNTAVTYVMTAGGATYTSAPVVVDFAADMVLQSLSGLDLVVPDAVLFGDFPREPEMRSAAFSVPGRLRPPVRFAGAGLGGSSVSLLTTGAATAALEALVLSGRPLVLRCGRQISDLSRTELILPTASPSTALPDGSRRWVLSFLLIDDPEPGTALSAFTWDDFDEAMTGRTWSAQRTRTNLAVHPNPVAGATGWGFQNGTGEATGSTIVNTTDPGPEGRVGFLRRVVTTPKTAGNSGWYYRETAASLAGVAGDVRTVSMWVRFSNEVQARMNIGLRVGSTTVTGAAAPYATVPANVWTRLSHTVTATGTFDNTQGWVNTDTTAVVATGGGYDARDVLVEAGAALGPYFDGSMSDTSTVDYAWTGAANASTSTATGPDPASFDGLFAASIWDDFDVYDWDQL